MHLSVIGSGYVETTIAACFADLGHDVVNVDIDEEIVTAINDGTVPIHENGLADLVSTHAGTGGTGRLRATTDYDAVRETDLTFLYLPTPQTDDGSIDLSIMQAGAKQLGATLAGKPDWHTVVVKSTVIPGSTERCDRPDSGSRKRNDRGRGHRDRDESRVPPGRHRSRRFSPSR